MQPCSKARSDRLLPASQPPIHCSLLDNEGDTGTSIPESQHAAFFHASIAQEPRLGLSDSCLGLVLQIVNLRLARSWDSSPARVTARHCALLTRSLQYCASPGATLPQRQQANRWRALPGPMKAGKSCGLNSAWPGLPWRGELKHPHVDGVIL